MFGCPVCYEPLIRKGPSGMNLPAIYMSGFKCSKCNKSFTSKDIFLDLTVTSGMKEYSELKPARTELFRSPLVFFLYERGWRQNFNRSGFPGHDEEFASSGAYSSVIALDFSENILRQCYDYIKQEENRMNKNLALVRADISSSLLLHVQLMPFMLELLSTAGHPLQMQNAGQLHFYRNETKHPTSHALCLALICELIDQHSKYIYLAWERISEDGCPNVYLFHCVSEKLPHLPNVGN
ncbi:uncharacterized methyltransferase At2g41040, chloroplastic-like [Triticum dicoccoides]|uniref:uncharacterized methyltransferase At2g41040, chloroplastic-like n=1 Tax=Triticum dicoccoides TaxID=85692 RepID=UPI001891AF7E|nr:uncharacterized methyltransferase At2g41040, chloroplastic-like [Triticum dicoccoides]